ncbi:MAG: DMT family transporter [Candidatus Moranbacteria bacterium]|nr:DMT family transporter [Candidatus Moranbacteria bacterium]
MNLNFLTLILNTWQFNVVAFLVTAVFFAQYYKLAVNGIKKDGVALVIFQLIGAVSILVLVPFFPMRFSNDPKIYGLLFAAVIFYTLNDRIQATIRKNLEVSIYSILNQFSKVFLVLYGIFIFKQEAVPLKLLGGCLILLGSMFLFYRKGKFTFNKYVLLAIVAAFCVATGLVIDVDISTKFNLPIYIMLTLAFPALIIFISEHFSCQEIFDEFMSIRQKYFLVTGISWGLMILFMIRALQLGQIVFIAPLMAVSVFLNVVVAYFLHKEHDHFLRKISVAIIIILGVYLIVT